MGAQCDQKAKDCNVGKTSCQVRRRCESVATSIADRVGLALVNSLLQCTAGGNCDKGNKCDATQNVCTAVDAVSAAARAGGGATLGVVALLAALAAARQ